MPNVVLHLKIPCRSLHISLTKSGRVVCLHGSILSENLSAYRVSSQRKSTIGWAVSNRMKRDLAIRALDMAVALRQPPKDCIHHTDRGSQYCSNEYQKRLKKHGFKVSMSGKGNCYDNSMVETFFKSIKAELIWRNRWETRRQAEGAIFQYINGFYNPRRRHSSLGGKSPLAFERKAA